MNPRAGFQGVDNLPALLPVRPDARLQTPHEELRIFEVVYVLAAISHRLAHVQRDEKHGMPRQRHVTGLPVARVVLLAVERWDVLALE
jgi:hypothetical protein